MTDWLLVIASLALVAASGVFVAAEFSFVTVDRASVERAADGGDARARGLRSALRSLSTQLSGAQLGITITNLAIGFLAEPAIAGIARGPLVAAGVAERNVPAVSLTVGLVLATVLTMVFGELVPKNLAIAHPLGVAKATQAFQRGFSTSMAVPIRLLNGSANAVVRGFGIEPQEELRSSRSPAELASLVRRSASQGTLDNRTAALMQRALAFGGRTAGAIMTPRVRMHSVDAREPADAVLELARHTGRSRFPVVEGGFDAVVGLAHIKHAIAVPPAQRAVTPVGDIAVAATLVPETLHLEELMRRLRESGMQMAVVVDEYGGTAGVVTLEDVVEEIVGEISDEHDPGRSVVRSDEEGGWVLSGLLRPDEVRAVTGVDLPVSADYDTLGGLLLHELGHIPEVGESVEVPGARTDRAADGFELITDLTVTLRVVRMAGRRIDQVGLLARHAEGER